MLRPDATLARHMSLEMTDRLGTALGHLVGDVLGRPYVPLRNPCPAAFGLQALLREQALGDNMEGLSEVFDRYGMVLATVDRPEGLVRPLAAPWFGPEEIGLLQAGFADDIGLTARLVPPPSDVTDEAVETIQAILACMARDAPEWHDEFRALVRQVVLASAPGDTQTFAGASAFDLWGAILVNPSYRRDPLHLAMTLVHESSHLKLFHAYLDDEIVLNDPDERFSSPLRREPRPMNGLYHAAFVLARMAAFASEMTESGSDDAGLGPEWKTGFRSEASWAVANFDSAYDIIRHQGRLTDKGAALIAEAASAVEDARQVGLAA